MQLSPVVNVEIGVGKEVGDAVGKGDGGCRKMNAYFSKLSYI